MRTDLLQSEQDLHPKRLEPCGTNQNLADAIDIVQSYFRENIYLMTVKQNSTQYFYYRGDHQDKQNFEFSRNDLSSTEDGEPAGQTNPICQKGLSSTTEAQHFYNPKPRNAETKERGRRTRTRKRVPILTQHNSEAANIKPQPFPHRHELKNWAQTANRYTQASKQTTQPDGETDSLGLSRDRVWGLGFHSGQRKKIHPNNTGPEKIVHTAHRVA